MARLVDEFKDAAARGQVRLPGEPRIWGVFGDLTWEPRPDVDEMLADPAFGYRTGDRHLAFQRIFGMIRYYAGYEDERIPDPDRASQHEHEMGMFYTVQDAVKFAATFLSGTPLVEIRVTRKGKRFLPDA